MKDFLNRAMARNREATSKKWLDFTERFPVVTERIITEIGEKPFHVRGPINLAAMDSIYLALLENPKVALGSLRAVVTELYKRKDFQQTIYYNTSDTATVRDRLQIVRSALSK